MDFVNEKLKFSGHMQAIKHVIHHITYLTDCFSGYIQTMIDNISKGFDTLLGFSNFRSQEEKFLVVSFCDTTEVLFEIVLALKKVLNIAF